MCPAVLFPPHSACSKGGQKDTGETRKYRSVQNPTVFGTFELLGGLPTPWTPDSMHCGPATRTDNAVSELDDARFHTGHDRAVAAAVGKPKVLRFSDEGSEYTADDFGAEGDFNEMYQR